MSETVTKLHGKMINKEQLSFYIKRMEHYLHSVKEQLNDYQSVDQKKVLFETVRELESKIKDANEKLAYIEAYSQIKDETEEEFVERGE